MKVKHWLWVYDDGENKDYVFRQFLTEEEAAEYEREFGYKNMRKIPWSEMEL